MRAIRRRYGRAKAVDRARAAYVAFCNEIGSDAVSEENAILSVFAHKSCHKEASGDFSPSPMRRPM